MCLCFSTDQMIGPVPEEMSRARCVPVRRVTHGDSRSFTEQPAVLMTCAAAGPASAATSFASRGSRPTQSHAEVAQPYGSVKPPQRLPRSGSIRAELIVAMGVALEVVLIFGLGLPEGTCLADLGRDLGTPEA